MPTGMNPKLEALIRWQKRPQIDRMLDMGESPDKVANWTNANGFKISSPTMYSYRDKRSEAILRGITLDVLLKEQWANVKMFTGGSKNKGLYNVKGKMKNDIELLDEVIQKGMDWMNENTDSYLTVNYAIRAIELKQRITDGKLSGMTFAGLEEYKRITEGRMQAMLEVVMGYIPDDIKGQVAKEMFDAERAFMEDNDLLDEFDSDEAVFDQANESNEECE